MHSITQQINFTTRIDIDLLCFGNKLVLYLYTFVALVPAF